MTTTGGEVVEDVERDRLLGGGVLAAAWLVQVGGAQDEQHGGDVDEFEDRDAGEQPADVALEDRVDAQAQLALGRSGDAVANGGGPRGVSGSSDWASATSASKRRPNASRLREDRSGRQACR